MSYAETAKTIGVSRSTVQSYVARARTKLAVQNRHIVEMVKTAEPGTTTGGDRMSTRVRNSAGKTGRKTAGVKQSSQKPHKAAATKSKAKEQKQATAKDAVFEKGSYDPGIIKTGTDINNDGV